MPREAQIGLLVALVGVGLAVLVDSRAILGAVLVCIGLVWAGGLWYSAWKEQRTLRKTTATILAAIPAADQRVLKTLVHLGMLRDEDAATPGALHRLTKTPFVLAHHSGQYTLHERYRATLQRLLKGLR